MDIAEFQRLIEKLYYHKDRERGKSKTLIWLGEELGEVFNAYRKEDREAMAEELADLMAWAASFANLEGIDLEEAVKRKYPHACSYCCSTPCECE